MHTEVYAVTTRVQLYGTYATVCCSARSVTNAAVMCMYTCERLNSVHNNMLQWQKQQVRAYAERQCQVLTLHYSFMANDAVFAAPADTRLATDAVCLLTDTDADAYRMLNNK